MLLDQNRKITSQRELQRAIKFSMKKLSDIVAKTLGPGGLPILIQRNGLDSVHLPLKPLVTKDGVTVARSIKLKDNVVNSIISSVIEVADRTNREVGDGTTTAIVLANALYQEGLKWIAIGVRPEKIYEEVGEVLGWVLQKLESYAIRDNTLDFIKSVATISANNDESIGEIIAGAFRAVGEEGVITLEEGFSSDHALRVEPGFQIQRGLQHPELFYTHPGREECVLSNCALVLYDGELSNEQDMIPILSKITEEFTTSNSFLIIARDIVGGAKNTLVVNRMEGRMVNFAFIKAPHVGHIRSQMLQDIAIATGGRVIHLDENGSGNNLRKSELKDLGYAKKIICSKYKTLIYDGSGDELEIIKRVDDLKEAKNRAESPYDAQILEQRIACLSGGIAVIEVGGKTEFEMKEKKDRIEDALNATKAAIQEGVIPGGGATLNYIAFELSEEKLKQPVGQKIFELVLRAPIKQILTNLGLNVDVIQHEIQEKQREMGSPVWGYDGKKRQVSNLIESHVIDPVKVVKSALLNSVSIANLLLTAGGAITNDTENHNSRRDLDTSPSYDMELQEEENE